MTTIPQYKDYRTISELLMSGECPAEMFALFVAWVSGEEAANWRIFEVLRDKAFGESGDADDTSTGN